MYIFTELLQANLSAMNNYKKFAPIRDVCVVERVRMIYEWIYDEGKLAPFYTCGSLSK